MRRAARREKGEARELVVDAKGRGTEIELWEAGRDKGGEWRRKGRKEGRIEEDGAERE